MLLPNSLREISFKVLDWDLFLPRAIDLPPLLSSWVKGLSFESTILRARLWHKVTNYAISSFMVDCTHLTLQVNKHTSKYQIFEEYLRLGEGNVFVILLEVNIEWPVLCDLAKAFSSIELEFQVWHVIPISSVTFAIKLPHWNLFRAVLHLFRDKFKLICD